EIKPIASDTLEVGDELPVVGSYDGTSDTAEFDFAPVTAADGGTTVEGTNDVDRTIDRASWERIESIDAIEPEHEHVYDFSVAGLET
ncbi:DNA-directed RNA polymerase subunit A'', partial [Salinisphaera sp. USBA-960]|nr:DNA-directed RNA polymerase subunit A'' [Salifodinibacter halophilus]